MRREKNYVGPPRAVFPPSAMTQVLISIIHNLVKISSPASIMLLGSLLVGLAMGLRRGIARRDRASPP